MGGRSDAGEFPDRVIDMKAIVYDLRPILLVFVPTSSSYGIWRVLQISSAKRCKVVYTEARYGKYLN